MWPAAVPFQRYHGDRAVVLFGRRACGLASPAGYRGDGIMPHFWDIVSHYKVAAFAGVPMVYSALSDVSREGADLSSVQFAASGSAPMPFELFNTFVEETKIPVTEG